MSRGLPIRFLTMLFFSTPTEIAVTHDDAEIAPLFVRVPNELPEELRRSVHADVYAQRLAAGHVALLLMHDGSLMHMSWIARFVLRVDELGCTLRLPEEEVCIYDVVTAATWRGRGVYPAVLTWMRRHAHPWFAAKRIWIYCEAENLPSRSGIGKAGYEPSGRRHAIVLAGRWRWSWGRVDGGVTCD